MPQLSQDVIDASEAAKQAYLNSVDPEPRQAQQGNHPVQQDNDPAGPDIPPAPPPPPPQHPAALRPAENIRGARVLADFWRESFFAQIKALIDPRVSQISVDDIDHMEYLDWFSYFYAQARRFLGAADDETLGRMYSVMFNLKSILNVNRARQRLEWNPFQPPLSLSRSFQTQLDRQPAVGFGILYYLLQCGFEEATTGEARQAILGDHRFADDIALRSALNEPVAERAARGQYVFAYRSDRRPPEQLVSQGCTRCRVALADWCSSSNVNRDWHPWHVTRDRRKMWIRKGNTDNDYFTVNSIAMDFHVACAYPIFRSREIGPDFNGDINGWSPELRTKLRASQKADFCRIRKNSTGEMVYVIFDRIQVYVCIMPEDTPVAKTYDAGGNYPEAGMRAIPLSDMVACFKVLRFHVPPAGNSPYCSTEMQGEAMTIQVKSWAWVNGEHCGQNALGLADPNIVAAKLDSLVNKVFDITHTTLVREGNNSTYFDPGTSQAPLAELPLERKAPVKAVALPKLTGR